jgi:hypothetical protein
MNPRFTNMLQTRACAKTVATPMTRKTKICTCLMLLHAFGTNGTAVGNNQRADVHDGVHDQ